MSKETADIGLIGLAVMGQNLVLNMNDHGYCVAVYNRTKEKVDEFMQGPAKNTQVIGNHDLKTFFSTLKRPRKVMLMIKAGKAVDAVIEQCLPFMEAGDVLIDGGNSHYPDSERRCHMLKEKRILFVGSGISGGEEGARHGPSIMPGGNRDAWPIIKNIFQDIAAKSEDGQPCCDWVGDGGAGHYVKMVHNGIEYGDIQIICEAYHLMKRLLDFDSHQLAQVFTKYNQGKLNSYLIEITSQIFSYKDQDGKPLVENILDVAGQKGTGKWTGISALELGMPVTLIAEAVFARCLSAMKEQRLELSKLYEDPKRPSQFDTDDMVKAIEDALYAAKIISYAQGFILMRAAAAQMQWNLNYGSIALMWRGGCIIRSRFLGDIKKAYDNNHDLPSLFYDQFFQKALKESISGLRKIVITASEYGLSIPCFSTALSFFDGYRTARLPSNLLQAQRDFFGAHTYERLDRPRGNFFHTDWTGSGGEVSSSTYNV